MKFQREFKLKPYWRKLRKGTKRDEPRTELYEFDGLEWIMGGHTITIRPEHTSLLIGERLENVYHRPNLCLKIHFSKPYFLRSKIDRVKWSGQTRTAFRENLVECAQIQNLLAFEGLSPRVYDLVFLVDDDRKYPAQVTEFVPSKTSYEEVGRNYKSRNKKIIDYCNKVGISYHDIGDGKNMRTKLFVDTQEFEFKEYEEGFRKRVVDGLTYSGDFVENTHIPYQDIEGFKIESRRKNKKREKLLDIDASELPDNFSVIDFGCNGSYFLRRALDKGAGYALGVDVPRVTKAAYELNNYLGYFNVDFADKVPDRQFDCGFLLSSFSYADTDDIFSKCKVIYIEGHSLNNQHTQEYYHEMLKPHYKKITFLGWNQDEKDLPPRVVMKGIR